MLPTLYDGLHGVIYRVQCQPTELNTPTGGDQAEGVLRPVEGPGAPRGTLRGWIFYTLSLVNIEEDEDEFKKALRFNNRHHEKQKKTKDDMELNETYQQRKHIN
ncbi:uncharacterized protein LOC143017626 isoform X1 [Oratosquilla oratoria]|uniref:uncharacterized protein LOC143017626 isoform X1 n=1 Tax=Oratosquilla oratoria TaxID=337810 RepID=UPI003F76FE27